MNTKVVIFLLIFILIFTKACKDKEDLVPNVYVNFSISLSDPEFADLQIIGNNIVVTGGVVGIVLYRYSTNEFMAYERNCTYKPSDRCGVAPDSTGLILKCPCCSSKFLITNGGHIEGEAERPLVNYNTSYDGIYLRVFN